MQVFFHIPNT
uniref:Uncharacterized protein n=1 Tax=Lepeophtheirus salmonis TaxID=72036 RepID=A0A0K2V7H9_LEPSM